MRRACGLVLLLGACGAYRLFDPDGDPGDEEYAAFKPYERGFVGQVDRAANWLAERVNEGAPATSNRGSNQWGSVPERQICPAMVGPVGNGRYYCRGKEFGYCDRRSGTCVCNTGYQGVDCGACTPTHYASGSLCYPKRTCPNECSGQGECDYATGACACLAHRRGEDCATPRCTLFDSLCEECTDATCVRCVEGHFYSNATGCASCTVHDPRCASCNEFQCLECVDPLLWSIRRSGKRRSDSELPADELRRELSTYLEFGTQREDAFDEAEPFRVATASKPLKDLATRCDEGFDGTATFNCSALVVPAPNGTNGTVPKLSHVVCGHEGTLAWSSPTYEVAEDSTNVRLTVLRTGGGVGAVAVSYSLEHLTTDGSDVSATAFYATSLRLEFAPGVVELSFLVTIHDDRLLEADEECAFRLHSPAGGAVLGPQRTTVLTIRDDDAFRTAARYSRWRGDWHGVAGVPSGIYVVAHSAFGQISRIGGDRFVVEVEPYALLDRPDFGDADYDAGTNSPFYVSAKARRIVAAVLDVGDGTYTGTWAAAAAGDYRARAWLAVPGGLRGAYYRDAFGEEISRRQPSAVAPRQVDDNLLLSRIDARVHFEWRTSSLATGLAAAQAGPDFAVVRWSGRLRPDKTERFTLFVSATGDGLGARLWLDGRLLIDCWDVRRQACGERSARAELVADALHLVVLELRVTRFAGGGLHKGPAPNVAGGRGKALSFEWASETVPRQVIPKENLYYMDELPVANASTFLNNGRLDAAAAAEAQSRNFPFDAYDAAPASVSMRRVSATVVSARTSADETYAVGAGLSRGSAGQPLQFGIYLCDAYGNRRDDVFRILPTVAAAAAFDPVATSAPALKFDALLGFQANISLRELNAGASSGVGALQASLTVDLSNGVAYASVVPTVAGTYQLDVTFRPNATRDDFESNADADARRHIRGSPFILTVDPASRTQAETSYAFGDGKRRGTAGEAMHFTIVAVDALGNERNVGGDSFDMVAKQNFDWGTSEDWSRVGVGTFADWERYCVHRQTEFKASDGLETSQTTVGAFRDFGNGTYLVEYTPTIAGEQTLYVTLGGAHVEGSPYQLRVLSNAAVAPSSTAEGPGLAHAKVNDSTWIVATARDGWGNPVFADVAGLSCEVVGPRNTTTVGTMTANYVNGTIMCSYQPIESGDSLCAVRFNGEHVHDSPFKVKVADGDVDGSTTFASGLGLTSAVAGVVSSFTIFAKDPGNNLIDDNARSNFTVLLTYGAEVVVGAVVHAGLGRYNATYNATVSGTYSLQVKDAVSGAHIVGSPFSPFLAPATCVGRTSTAIGRGLEPNVVACRASRVVVTARDAFGNVLLHSNDRIHGVFRGGGALNGSLDGKTENFTVEATALGSGLYDISYEPRVAGAHKAQFFVLEPGLDAFAYGQFTLERLLSRRAVSAVDFDFGAFAPYKTADDYDASKLPRIYDEVPQDYFSLRYTGRVEFDFFEETYGFKIETDIDSVALLYLDGVRVLGAERKAPFAKATRQDQVLGPWEGSFKPNSKVVTFELTWQHERGADARIKLFWTHTSANNVDLERLSDYVVVPAANFWRSALIGDFTFDYDVIPGPTAASTSTVVHSDTYASGEWHAPFAIIETRDACSNLRLRGGDAVALVLFGPGGAAELAAVTDNGNGTYRTDLLVPTTGGYAASALVGAKASAAAALAVGDRYSPLISRADADASFLGSQVQDSPFTVDVVAGIASEETSSLSGAPLIGGVVSERPAIVYVDLRDATYNAAVEEPLESITATLTLRRRSSRHSVPKSSRDATPNVTVAKVGPSRFALTFTLYTAGLWDLTAKLRGKAVAGPYAPAYQGFSPVVGYYEIVCHAGPYATARSGAWGAVPRVAKADVDAEPSRRFTVVARDALGNDLESGGSWFRVRLRGSQIPAGGSPAYALDNGDGSYGIAWTTRGLQRGAYAVFVDVARQLAGARGGGGGLVGHYFTNGGLFGDADLVRDDAGPLDYDWGTGEVSPGAADHASVRWTGLLAAPLTGLFTLEVAVADADDAARIFLDGALVCETAPGQLAAQGSVRMVRGGMYALTVEYHEVRGSAGVALRWASDEVLMQPVPAFYLFPDSAAIDGSPFPLQLAEAGNATNVVYAADYADPAQPRTMYTHDGSVRLGEPVAPVNLPTLEPTS